jgi:acyl-CoA hydrolase
MIRTLAASQPLTFALAATPAARHILALCMLILLTVGCGKEKLAPLAGDARVLVVGDSISAGFGVDPSQAWPQLLAQRSGWRVVNGGVNGDLSADALGRLPGLLEKHAPHLVVLEIGGNDMLRGAPEGRIRANLETMIVAAKAAGAQVAIIAVPRPSLMGAALSSLRPADFYSDIADSHGVALVDDALSAVLSRPDLKLDPLHPNASGHADLAERISEALRDIGLLR